MTVGVPAPVRRSKRVTPLTWRSKVCSATDGAELVDGGSVDLGDVRQVRSIAAAHRQHHREGALAAGGEDAAIPPRQPFLGEAQPTETVPLIRVAPTEVEDEVGPRLVEHLVEVLFE